MSVEGIESQSNKLKPCVMANNNFAPEFVIILENRDKTLSYDGI